MTNIKQKAVELVNEVRAEYGYTTPITYDWFNDDSYEHIAFLNTIERDERFRQEVSDAMLLLQEVVTGSEEWKRGSRTENIRLADGRSIDFGDFIIPEAKPDPLVEAVKDILDDDSLDNAEEFSEAIRAALAKRGGRIVFDD